LSGCASIILGSGGIPRLEGDKIKNEIDFESDLVWHLCNRELSKAGKVLIREKERGYLQGVIDDKLIDIEVIAVGEARSVYTVRAVNVETSTPDLYFAQKLSTRIHRRLKSIFEW